jgi:hypothetical protein
LTVTIITSAPLQDTPASQFSLQPGTAAVVQNSQQVACAMCIAASLSRVFCDMTVMISDSDLIKNAMLLACGADDVVFLSVIPELLLCIA